MSMVTCIIEVIEQMLDTDAQESAIMDQGDCFAEQGCSVCFWTWPDTLPWKSGFCRLYYMK
jgi:hypothetical protein